MLSIPKQKIKSTQWLAGTVHWFDETSGEGMIKSEDGTNYYVHYSAIESNKKWKTLKDRKKVIFQKVEDVTFAQVTKVKEI